MRFDYGVTVRIRDAYASRHEPEAARVLGEFVWAIQLILITLIVLCSIGFGIWEFMRPLEVPEDVGVGSTRKGFVRSDLQKVLEGFDVRAQRYEERRTAPVPVRDPS